MGTPANHALLEETGLATPESRNAHAEDLILTVDADTDPEAEAALAAARQLLFARRHAVETATALRPRTLDSALKILPNANLVAISVPGAYAKFEAMRALKRGLHVFLFSDNVPVQDEIELKREAVKRRLVCMGPDCGTAYLNGTGIGFYNVVPRGRIGIVAASGTGLQAVASRLAAQGEGVSHGIGVGGRDLSAEVGGAMSLFALESLAGDSTTEAIILISKPPHPTVLPRLEAAMARTGKPVVACVLGATRRPAVRRSGSKRSTTPRTPWSHAWRTAPGRLRPSPIPLSSGPDSRRLDRLGPPSDRKSWVSTPAGRLPTRRICSSRVCSGIPGPIASLTWATIATPSAGPIP